MLLPKKTKYRKYQRGRRRGISKGQTNVQAGDYGLKALEPGWVRSRQIAAGRIAMHGKAPALTTRLERDSKQTRETTTWGREERERAEQDSRSVDRAGGGRGRGSCRDYRGRRHVSGGARGSDALAGGWPG